jgi:hypothetical protein
MVRALAIIFYVLLFVPVARALRALGLPVGLELALDRERASYFEVPR